MADRKSIRGSSLLEIVTVSTFLAVSSMGLGSALVSGATLTDKAHRRMSQVATAENIMEQIRQVSQSNLSGVVTEYDGFTTAASSSIGFANDAKRLVTVSVPLSESSVPGGIDLNANGDVDFAVDPADARILVVDIEGADKLRLRTAVLDLGRLPGIVTGPREQDGQPVAFGETYGEQGNNNTTTTSEPPPPETQSTVSVVGTSMNGKSAEVVLINESTGNRTVSTITVAPSKDNLYFEGISINGELLFYSPSDQAPGTVTLEPGSELGLAPGEATLQVGDFYEIKDGQIDKKTPDEVVLTITFDDGSVVTVVVKD